MTPSFDSTDSTASSSSSNESHDSWWSLGLGGPATCGPVKRHAWLGCLGDRTARPTLVCEDQGAAGRCGFPLAFRPGLPLFVP